MLDYSKLASRLHGAIPGIFALSLLFKFGCSVWLAGALTGATTPNALLSRPTELVQLAFDNSRHFGLNTPQGLAESASIVPNDGLITDPTDNATYTVSMFHQLGCLSVIANEITRDTTQQPKPSRLGRHCLNYLRQMIECRGDTQLESFQSTNSKAPVDIHTTYVCRDWGKLYDQVNELNNA